MGKLKLIKIRDIKDRELYKELRYIVDQLFHKDDIQEKIRTIVTDSTDKQDLLTKIKDGETVVNEAEGDVCQIRRIKDKLYKVNYTEIT